MKLVLLQISFAAIPAAEMHWMVFLKHVAAKRRIVKLIKKPETLTTLRYQYYILNAWMKFNYYADCSNITTNKWKNLLMFTDEKLFQEKYQQSYWHLTKIRIH